MQYLRTSWGSTFSRWSGPPELRNEEAVGRGCGRDGGLSAALTAQSAPTICRGDFDAVAFKRGEALLRHGQPAALVYLGART